MREAVRLRSSERLRRLRWRLRGAWLWPTFGLLTLVDTALLHWLPLAGDTTGWVSALLLAGCVNIVAVAALGGLGGWWLRRRRPDLPKIVADDYVGTGLLVAITAAFLTIGLVHRPQVLDEREDFAAQSQQFRTYVRAQAGAEHRRHLAAADSIRLQEDLYRTCVPGNDPRRWLCAYLDTSGRPVGVTRDRNREPNASLNAAGGYR